MIYKQKLVFQKEIETNGFIPPPGHVSILKSDTDNISKHTLISTGGFDFEQGKEWDFAEDLFGMEIESTDETFKIIKHHHVQSFKLTTPSDIVRMEKCAAMTGYSGGTMVDLKPETDGDIEALKFGGQNLSTMVTENRMEIIRGNSKFERETRADGVETKTSKFKTKAYPATKRKLNTYVSPIEYSLSDEEVQKNTPSPRMGHAMSLLKENICLMTGGVNIPEAGPNIEHPKDSSMWLLHIKEKEWEQCNNCELTVRTGHAMMVHMEKAYIVGGYTYVRSKLTKLFPINEVVELSVMTSEIINTRKFIVTNLTSETIPNIYGFSSTSTSNFMYTYGGHNLSKYNAELENMHIFHSPYVDRHTPIPQSSTLFEINMLDETIRLINAPQEFNTANGSMHVLSKQEDNSADKIALLGGYSRKLVLYSKSDFTLTKCDLHENYGGCRLMMMTPTTIT